MDVIVQVPVLDYWHGVVPAEVRELNPIYDMAADIGVTHIRFSIPWAFTRPLSNAWDEKVAARVDLLVAAIRSRGLVPVPVIGGACPCWASSAVGKDCSTYDGRNTLSTLVAPPTDWANYRAAVTATVDRWDIGGIEVMNEPNHPNAPSTPLTEVNYHIHARTAVAASTRPSIPIHGGTIAGTLATSPTDEDDEAEYLTSMYQAGAFAGSFDYLVLHPYGINVNTGAMVPPSEYLEAEVNRIRAVTAAHDPGRKFVYNEMGWTTDGAYYGWDSVTEEQKGEYIAEGLLWQAAQSDTQMCGWYTLFRPGNVVPVGGTTPTNSSFGIVDVFGKKTAAYRIVKEAVTTVRSM